MSLLLVLLVGAAGTAAGAAGGEWPMFGGDAARTNIAEPPRNLPTGVNWTLALGPGSGSVAIAAPVLHGDKLLVGSSTGLLAVDAASGIVRWTAPTPAWVIGAPAVANGTAYGVTGGRGTGATDGAVVAVDIGSGSTLWQFPTEAYFVDSPVVAGGVVYVADFNGTLYALDAETGFLQWSTIIGVGGLPSSAAVSDSIVVIANGAAGEVRALDASTGAALWSYSVTGGTGSSPAIQDGQVFFGGDENSVHAVELRTGRTLWKAPVGGFVSKPVAISGGTLVAVVSPNSLRALSTADGALLWSYEVRGRIHGPPAITQDGTVVFGDSTGRIYALSIRDGNLLGSTRVASFFHGAVTASGGAVFIVSDHFRDASSMEMLPEARLSAATLSKVDRQSPFAGTAAAIACLLCASAALHGVRQRRS